MKTPIKSLGKFTPRVDPAVRSSLAGNGTEALKASVPNVTAGTAGTNPAPAKVQQPQRPKVRHSEISVSETRQPRPSVTIRIELCVQIIDDPEKYCPSFGYISRGGPPGTQRIVAVLNENVWPTAAALQRGDVNALRWLTSLAVVDRCQTWPAHPILRAVGRHLAKVALGDCVQDYQLGLWTAYRLRNHTMFAGIDSLSILKRNPGERPSAIEKFASFDVEVDSVRLESWRAKFGAKHKSREKMKGSEIRGVTQ